MKAINAFRLCYLRAQFYLNSNPSCECFNEYFINFDNAIKFQLLRIIQNLLKKSIKWRMIWLCESTHESFNIVMEVGMWANAYLRVNCSVRILVSIRFHEFLTRNYNNIHYIKVCHLHKRFCTLVTVRGSIASICDTSYKDIKKYFFR